MLLPRIIPSLLISNDELVKTINFKNPAYIGDPINTSKIFSEFEADELLIFDISASANNMSPNLELLEKIAKQCRMPVCYGGGIKSVKQSVDIVNLGIEKIALSSILFEDINIIQKLNEKIGSQSVVGVLDVKVNANGNYSILTDNGKKLIDKDPVKICEELQQFGIGEIIINCIDGDGTKNGINLNLLSYFSQYISVPITIMGGLSSIEEIEKIVEKYGVIGIGVGSLFVYKGQFNAVLINYPSKDEKRKIFKKYLQL
ncbi:AglZ/HisF2 family acetamidino modification protein [Pedobacter punctiformis]|uniref:AglZ/HisF2 family acetamidino modification protein n=1 Tax=Pedobacter punctiformis TaxID=3004097 RepID=A0ABT4L501_9SPHI|nr:AglZ/HisF2 family acetamidino modification protein [Pedobacter sp. HCMS5-2]MCZ4242906.1 AglZ/HisF2 family acetamidino modification protein [Pedobacter sp. HCMS5-2]